MAEKPKVFLDANIVIAGGKPPGGPEIARVLDLVDAGLVSVLTTDLTIAEVAKKHTQNDFDAIKEICQPHFRKIAEGATGISLPELKRPQLRQKLKATYDHQTVAMFKSLKAKTLAIPDHRCPLQRCASSSPSRARYSRGRSACCSKSFRPLQCRWSRGQASAP